ncbi:MAG: 7-cyano-7-deazaguanine synthase QueC [Leptospiraceae bacterium]|nr:7-cyano-7-deazaguanine synthase QueC [Leptospiraceae bacterium]MCP5510750.1 7-cyano-7-deazaguanine synthase QueC [Leptospiraceae bacterium]
MQKISAEKKALIILSGGLDSTVCLYFAREKYTEIETISFDYSQKHKIELQKARRIAGQLGVRNTKIKIDTGIFQNSSLVDKSIPVPKKGKVSSGIPNTYVPGRNLLFLSYAVSFAESRGIGNIFIGVNALDYSGYPDCRPEFISAFEKTVALGTKEGVGGKGIQIHTPLLHLNKKEIVELGKKLKVPFGKTHSCYDPIDGKPCGKCESCVLRKKGFAEAGILDE